MRLALMCIVTGAFSATTAMNATEPATHKVKIENKLSQEVLFQSIGAGEDARWRRKIGAGRFIQDSNHVGGQRIFAVWANSGELLAYSAHIVDGNMEGAVERSEDGKIFFNFGHKHKTLPIGSP